MTTAPVEPQPLLERRGVEVFGDPKPKGSMSCDRSPMHKLHDNIKGGPAWQKAVAKIAPLLGGPYFGPVGVAFTVTVAFPKSLRPEQRVWPITHGTGDSDKHARPLLDALEQAGVLTNDAQVVELIGRKAYPHSPCADVMPRPGVRIRIYPIGELS